MSELHAAPGSALRIWTYKDPSTVLARFAHDLCFELTDLELSVRQDGERLEVALRLAPRGLRLLGSAQGEALTPVKPKDQTEIERTARDAVLEVGRHPEVRFEGAGPAAAIQGTLHLHGQARPLTVACAQVDGRWRGEALLTPSAWGIKPYRAFLGALKLADRVRVTWDVALA